MESLDAGLSMVGALIDAGYGPELERRYHAEIPYPDTSDRTILPYKTHQMGRHAWRTPRRRGEPCCTAGRAGC